jgi:hypothetical protein
MTKTSAIATCVVLAGAVAVAIWLSPIGPTRNETNVAPAAAPATPASRPAANPSNVTRVSYAPVMSPTLMHHTKPLLNEGTDMSMAAKGFRSAEQFAAVAHAARNLDIPFVVLKDKVLERRMSLTSAIRATKPDVNAGIEAERALAEARSDLARKR